MYNILAAVATGIALKVILRHLARAYRPLDNCSPSATRLIVHAGEGMKLQLKSNQRLSIESPSWRLSSQVPLKSIVAGIEAVEVIPGRCEVVDEGQEFSVIVDAASTPEALDAMLSTLRGNAKNIFTVFGCQGERDRTVRPKMAEVAHAKSDFVLMCNDSPRREDPAQIMQVRDPDLLSMCHWLF